MMKICVAIASALALGIGNPAMAQEMDHSMHENHGGHAAHDQPEAGAQKGHEGHRMEADHGMHEMPAPQKSHMDHGAHDEPSHEGHDMDGGDMKGHGTHAGHDMSSHAEASENPPEKPFVADVVAAISAVDVVGLKGNPIILAPAPAHDKDRLVDLEAFITEGLVNNEFIG